MYINSAHLVFHLDENGNGTYEMKKLDKLGCFPVAIRVRPIVQVLLQFRE